MKNRKSLCVIGWLAWALAAGAADPRWTLPPQVPEGVLPKLSQPLTLDGDLAEWGAAAAVPLRFSSYIAHRNPTHDWRGPADCGLEVLCAWNDAGLCLAGFVADDDVRNNSPADTLWAQDCLELYVDGRSDSQLMKPPYTKGAYQMLIRPPVNHQAVLLAVNPEHGEIPGARIAGKLVPGGWTFELLIPWAAFGNAGPRVGRAVGLQFGLDDYDARDGESVQPLMISWQGATKLYMSPEKMIRWTLAEVAPRNPDTHLDAVVALDIKNPTSDVADVEGAVELGRSMTAGARSADFAVFDWTGRPVARGPVELRRCPAPWQDSLGGKLAWAPGTASDGVYRLEVSLADEKGLALGKAQRHVLFLRRLQSDGRAAVDAALRQMERAQLMQLAQADPFRARAWMGVGACIEKTKRAVEIYNSAVAQAAVGELRARVAVLTGEALPSDCTLLHRLLALTAHPEAQVMVEYPVGKEPQNYEDAYVSFTWGLLPLAGVMVYDFPDGGAAAQYFKEQKIPPGQKDAVPEETFDGLRSIVITNKYDFGPFDLSGFDPTNQVLLCSFGLGRARAMDRRLLDTAQAEGALLLDPLPAPMAAALQSWLAQARVPRMTAQEAAAREGWCLLAGNLKHADVSNALSRLSRVSLVRMETNGAALTVLDGARVFYAPAPSRAAAEKALRLVRAGKPITAAEAESLRQTVVAALPKTAPPPVLFTNMGLYAGDLHTHTFYSDGIGSPVGLALNALYTGMDFLAITDHNRTDGAQLAARLLAACGVDFPLMVGEEITTPWAHMTAYPVQTVVSANLSPYETVRAVHQQGAVLQWNHPYGTDFWIKKIAGSGWSALGLDAWEHTMAQYDMWKADGRLPPMVGTSDTHNGIFGGTERTVIFAASPAGADIAEAVRRGDILLAGAWESRLLYGSDAMIARVAAADGEALRRQAAARIRTALERADIPALLRASPAHALTAEETANLVLPASVPPATK